MLGVSESWFYKWIERAADPPGCIPRPIGAVPSWMRRWPRRSRPPVVCTDSPRLVEDLREQGWTVSEKSVAASMRRQHLVARQIKRRNGLTRQDKTAPKFADLVNRDFGAGAPNLKWVGDMTEIPTECGKLYLATVIDLFSRRLLGRRRACTRMRSWRARRSRWPWPPGWACGDLA